jgi:tetratricopeptide (TPR) repeat protein
MERKKHLLQAFVRCLLLTASGCGTGASVESAVPVTAPGVFSEQLFEKGLLFAGSGQSIRAEQYFLAAVEEGENWDTVFPHLVETCVGSGRFRSALSHVQDGLRRSPDDPALHHLAASLYLGLGQLDDAYQEVALLEAGAMRPMKSLLFLGEFFATVAHDEDRARRYYREFLASYPESPDALWVRAELRRQTAELEVSGTTLGAHSQQEGVSP